MNQICRKTFRVDLRRRINRRVSTLKKYVRVAWERILRFSCCKVSRYRQLSVMATSASATPSPSVLESCFSSGYPSSTSLNNDDHNNNNNSNSDLVSLKIGLLGDCHIGKTSFLMKYVGNGKEESDGGYEINKTLFVKGARISYSIWEVEGDDAKAQDQIPVACKDSVAILFMFDLTSRCTLNSVISWYKQAKKYNQAAIPIMIGTKFDDFIQLPLDLQWTIASQARSYAKAINATLFFSSATYNINVNKIFKFITAKLFDLPWTVERNLTIGEPIIDF